MEKSLRKNQNQYLNSKAEKSLCNRAIGRAATCSSLERKVRSLNLGPVKLHTMLPTARHCCDIFSQGAAVLHADAMTRRLSPRTRYTLRRNIVNMIKDLIRFEISKITLYILHYFTLFIYLFICVFVKFFGKCVFKVTENI